MIAAVGGAAAIGLLAGAVCAVVACRRRSQTHAIDDGMVSARMDATDVASNRGSEYGQAPSESMVAELNNPQYGRAPRAIDSDYEISNIPQM